MEKTGLRGQLDQVRVMGVEVERLMREKSDGEVEIRVLKGKINELTGKVEMDKEQLRKVCDERDLIKNGSDRLKEKESNLEKVIAKLKSENDKLVKEREVREELIQVVNKEKISLEKTVDEGKKEVEGLKSEIKALLSEKNDMESVKIKQKGEIEELKKKVYVLQKDCDDQTKINDKLSCKVGQLNNSLAQVELKREEADKALVEEKRHVEDLKVVVLKSEKTTETATTEDLEIEGQSLLTAMNDLESQCESLKSEKAILQEKRVQLKEAMGALKTKVEAAGMDAERNLAMLKRTASVLCELESREDRLTGEQQKRENGKESYAVELESMEKAFRNKVYIIEEMKKEAVVMKQATEAARNMRNFWIQLSAILAIFGAASFFHATRCTLEQK
ncbi:PREDICTED: LOW QUALITY PROTEIN: myosin-4-like [Camelina sativa]|uniref:LOW QUALITY PROTEIN: myosin-4-like n=1 Tax=Camelina sativa TaxID=90675 RepID=A0ABM0T8Y0_CAMSA|nr:PREDICTED: LOW QUALITY PROTEIN: myosin-4-like [Camelina sativa]